MVCWHYLSKIEAINTYSQTHGYRHVVSNQTYCPESEATSLHLLLNYACLAENISTYYKLLFSFLMIINHLIEN
jgi:hypothetical protein